MFSSAGGLSAVLSITFLQPISFSDFLWSEEWSSDILGFLLRHFVFSPRRKCLFFIIFLRGEFFFFVLEVWINMDSKRKKDSPESNELTRSSPFPDEVLERVLGLVKSHKDRSSVSLVCKDWYNAERWSRTHVFIGNCYSVSPEIVARRFPNIRSVTLKGKPRFSDFNLVPLNWGADIHAWLVVFASKYPLLEELRLKRMTVTDESLEFLATTFTNFKALSLLSCDGFSTDGLAAIATHCKYGFPFPRPFLCWSSLFVWLLTLYLDWVSLYWRTLISLDWCLKLKARGSE